jgi:hypothetical protein
VRFTVIAEKGKGHSASVWYTLRASGRENQMSQAQFRSNSGALVVVNDEEVGKEMSRFDSTGSVQATIAGAIKEN